MNNRIYGHILALIAGTFGLIGGITSAFGLYYSFVNDSRALATVAISVVAWGMSFGLVYFAKTIFHGSK